MRHSERSRWARRRVVAAALTSCVAMTLAACGSGGDDAGDFPQGDLTVIAAGNPGGGLDTAARQLEAALTSSGVDTKVTVENNGGGGGNPARAELLKRPHDGSTLVAESNRVFLNPILGTTTMTLDDFKPIAQLTNDVEVWAVRADSPYKTAQDVLDKLKKDPSSVTFGVGTVPSDDQINILMAAKTAGVKDLSKMNIVAFKSGGDLNTELLGGHVEIVSTGLSEAGPLAESGDVRLLSISSAEPVGGAAEGVPTWKEIGLDMTVSHWRGVFGPADMPDEAVAWWQENIEKAIATDTWKDGVEKLGLQADYLPPKDFASAIAEQEDQYKALLEEVGLAKK